MTDTTMRCPYCAEEILAAAIKCKHCGEMIDEPPARPAPASTTGPARPPRCAKCLYQPTSAQDERRHQLEVHTPYPRPCSSPGCHYQVRSVDDAASHARYHDPAGARLDPAKKTKKQKLSDVGDPTEAGLACPKCRGSNFTVKRSGKAKVMLGPASLLVKGSQVRCISCGTVFKRG